MFRFTEFLKANVQYRSRFNGNQTVDDETQINKTKLIEQQILDFLTGAHMMKSCAIQIQYSGRILA